jgi:hypothetical protein
MKITNNYKPDYKKTLLLFFALSLIIFSLVNWNTEARQPIEFRFNEGVEDLQTSVQYKGYNQAVTAYKAQIETMIKNWYSATRVLDLLGIKSMECNRYDWLCKWIDRNSGNLIDIWPFQINRIHREQFNKSLELFEQDKRAELFLYQLDYANQLVQSYEDRFCGERIFSLIGRDFTNEGRFKCNAVSYNWHPTWKQIFSELAWEKRKIISDWLVENSNFIEFYNLK